MREQKRDWDPVDYLTQIDMSRMHVWSAHDPEATRQARDWLKSLNTMSHSCRADHQVCWGFVMVRTSYGDDLQFERAVAAIDRLVRHFVFAAELALARQYLDERMAHSPGEFAGLPPAAREVSDAPNVAFWSMHHNDFVEDRAALDGASIEEASAAFTAYVEAGDSFHGTRGRNFVLLDQETLDQLDDVPGDDDALAADPDPRRICWSHWIKVVNVMEGEKGQMKVRLWDLVEAFFDLYAGDGVAGARKCTDSLGDEWPWYESYSSSADMTYKK